MKKILFCLISGTILLSCSNNKAEPATTATEPAADSTVSSTVDLPYKASYSSNFTTDVSDADLKMVMASYKDWADGNMSNVAKAYSDTVEWERTTGDRYRLPNAGIMKMWTASRDSMSSVVIDMQAWQKMYAADQKQGHIVTWYKEIDTYKSGKVDSGYYHDINRITDGKISYFEQYKRPAK